MTLTMRADVREKWWKALESGHYKQGAGALHVRGKVQNGVEVADRFCCLGVLCALAEEAGAVEINSERAGSEVSYGGETAYLPPAVIDWAGLRYEGERLYTESRVEEQRGIIDNKYRSREPGVGLALMNDQGEPFAKIAKVIKEKIQPY